MAVTYIITFRAGLEWSLVCGAVAFDVRYLGCLLGFMWLDVLGVELGVANLASRYHLSYKFYIEFIIK